MATTTNFGWATPNDTDFVKDGAAAIRTLGSSIDTSFVDLKGGTTGQILSKASATDLDYTWITNDVGDITGVTAGTGLSGGGTSGAVTLSIDTATTVDLSTAQTLTNKTLTSPVLTTPTISTIDAKGDLLAGTADNTIGRRSIGANGTVLTADSAEATGLKWATPASSALTFIKSQTIGSLVSSVTVSSAFSATYDNYLVTISNTDGSSDGASVYTRLGSTTTNYYGSFYVDRATTGTASTVRQSNGDGFPIGAATTNDDSFISMTISSPFLSARSAINGLAAAGQYSGWFGGVLQDTTSYTAFTVFLTGGATISGGTIRVYGYQNS